jgi:hypothetical protein
MSSKLSEATGIKRGLADARTGFKPNITGEKDFIVIQVIRRSTTTDVSERDSIVINEGWLLDHVVASSRRFRSRV